MALIHDELGPQLQDVSRGQSAGGLIV